MLKIFKPNWIVIEVHHERHTFDTYYTYCRHMTLKEIEDLFMLKPDTKKEDRLGALIYDECGEYGDVHSALCETNETYYLEFPQYHINYTIVIPEKMAKRDQYFICGHTENKFGLFDRKWIECVEKDNKESTNE